MNPQFGPPPPQPYGVRGPVPASSAPSGPLPHQSSFNGYNTSVPSGYMQANKGIPHVPYGPPNSQNGPMPQRPPAPNTQAGVSSNLQYMQKGPPGPINMAPVPKDMPPISGDQLSQQMRTMQLSPNLPPHPESMVSSLPPPSGLARPPVNNKVNEQYMQPPGAPENQFGQPPLPSSSGHNLSSGYPPHSNSLSYGSSGSGNIPPSAQSNLSQYPASSMPPISACPPNMYGPPSQGIPSSQGHSQLPVGSNSYGITTNAMPQTIYSGQNVPGPGGQNLVQPNAAPGMTAVSQSNGPSSISPPPGVQYMPPASMQARYPSMPPPQQPGTVPQQPQYQQQYPQQPARMGTPMSSMPPAQPQPARRLDPNQMPSPIQVVEDDRKSREGEFFTGTRGQVPPLVTTNFTVRDQGICSPRFIRSTIYNVPCTADMLKQTSVPFAVTISPFACLAADEMEPPISNLGDSGPVRCNRCKAYMCPFMQFIDGGRRFQCVFCKGMTDVPAEYFSHLDHMGQRVDKFQRPELCLGSYEFIATKDYCRNGKFPNSPAFIFMVDVSYNSVKSGMVKLLCSNMKSVLSNLPSENNDPSQIRVGFVTYSSVVHFYNVKGTLAQPQMLVVSDIQDMFMPLLDGFLVTVQEAETIIDSLMEQIPLMFADTRETETILGPVIQAGLEALKAADCSGKLFIFHSSLPIAEAPGKLKNRDDRKLLGTDKEKTILTPQSTFYNLLGQECVAACCCVDLFLFPNAYIDIATLGQVCRITGGQVYKYNYFQADIDGTRFLEDLKRDIEKPIAFDAIMRVRTSTGIRPTEFYGNYYMSNTTDIELATIDSDKAISVEIKYDDKLVEEDGAYIQAAILFTSCSGQRRLRIHNLALNTCSQMAELFRSCELDTIINHFSKEAIRLITEQVPRQVKDAFITRSAQMLACYRKNCANPSSAGQLILPECMKLLPLYINSLIKSDAVAGGQEITTDDRSFVMLAVNSMDVASAACYHYPRLLPLHTIDPNSTDMPVALRCTIEKIEDRGVYLLENGLFMFLWIGMAVNSEWIQDVFGVQSSARIDIDKSVILELNTPLSIRVRSIIEQVRKERQRYMKLMIVRQGDKTELFFRMFLVEDRSGEGSASYVDFLCHLHKEIRSLLT